MPPVVVQYVAGLLTEEASVALADTIERVASAMFSTKEWSLTTADFDFTFQERGPLDRTRHKIIVRFQFHHFAERMADADTKANTLATCIGRALAPYLSYDAIGLKDIGVSILFAEIGWSVSGLNYA